MKMDHYLLYGAAAAGVSIAVFAGMPLVFLLVAACPLMMFFMMRGMQAPQEPATTPAAQPVPTPPSPNDPQSLSKP